VTLRATRWLIAIVGGTLVLLALIASAGSRTATLRQLLIGTLADRLDSEVELQSFSVDTFPTVHITGTGLTIRHKGRRDVPPLVAVDAFAMDGGLIGLFSRPRHFRTVSLKGLKVNIPPGGLGGGPKAGDSTRPADEGSPAAIVVDLLEAEDAALVLIPKRQGKEPKVFAVHRLKMKPLGRAQTMTFEASITNPVPKGLVKATGTFGPWSREDPGQTPLTGRYTFDHADLTPIKGIAGMLSSKGSFDGQLDRIGVQGETDTPDFRLDVSGTPVPLHTRFEAVVDGTDGDTYLNAVSGSFLKTSLTARGAVVGAEGVKGRTVKVHVKIDDGRIEDVLRLAVKGNAPAMTGALALHADLDVPAGPADVMDRMHLRGQFNIAGVRFTSQEVQKRISDMSERARGLDPAEHSENVSSSLRGDFTLERKTITLRDTAFGIPGAQVQIAGTYGLANETLEFDGNVRMRASVSEAAGGMKGVLLKAIDPVFRKDGAGAVVPIKIRGSRTEPKFGLDFGRVFHSEPSKH
jgi:AsmA-like C-terminal region